MSEGLVTLVSPQTEFEANILAIVLRDNGIDAFVFGSSGSGMGVSFSSGGLGIPLQVREEDVEHARQVLLDNKRHSIDIDWDELEYVGTEEEPYVVKQMPITARIGFFFAVLALLAGLVVVILQFSL